MMNKVQIGDCTLYQDCSVCPEWRYFMDFRAWMMMQDWKGKQLDKDLLVPGNKIYSPDTCIFVTSQLNTLLNNRRNDRGEWPLGVSWHKQHKKFRATCGINGKSKHLGYFDTSEEASHAYIKAKYSHILNIASQQSDKRIANGLRKHAELLKER